MNNFTSLFEQIKNNKYKPISSSIFNTLQDEGFTEETNIPYKDCYEFTALNINDSDKEALKQLNNAIIEKYNIFDIQLKEKLGTTKYIDLIDYDKGKINIVRLKKSCQ